MGYGGKFFNIQNAQHRVGDSLGEKDFGIGSKRFLYLGHIGVLVHKCNLNAQLLHSNGEEVKGSPVDRRSAHEMVARLTDIEYRIKRTEKQVMDLQLKLKNICEEHSEFLKQYQIK